MTESNYENTSMFTLITNTTTSFDKAQDVWRVLGGRDENLLSDVVRQSITQVLECGFRTSLAIMGVFTNVTTLVVLAVQGLKDSVNISLFALTLSDLAYVVTLLPGQQHCFYVAEDEVKANSLKQEFIPHGVMLGIAFSRVSAGITALISVERCLCVMLPLKVQRLVTYRCTLFAITSICLALLALFVPVLMMLEIQHVDIGGNRTAAYAVPTAFFRENFTLLSVFSDTVISVVIPVSLLAIVAVCTAVTVIRLKTSSKWRQAVSSASSDTAKSRTPSRSGSHVQTQEPVHVTRQQKPTSVDDKTVRLTRMMVAIACIYIVCIIPGTISTLVRLFIPEFSLNDRYHNMFAVVYALDFTMLTFNSSVNFFVYLAMSSRFRQIFLSLVTRCCRSSGQMARLPGNRTQPSLDSVNTEVSHAL